MLVLDVHVVLNSLTGGGLFNQYRIIRRRGWVKKERSTTFFYSKTGQIRGELRSEGVASLGRSVAARLSWDAQSPRAGDWKAPWSLELNRRMAPDRGNLTRRGAQEVGPRGTVQYHSARVRFGFSTYCIMVISLAPVIKDHRI